MTDIRLYLSIGIPVFSNAALLGMLVMYTNARFDTVNTRIDGLRYEMTAKFESQKEQLLRVEGVLDARLKHVEENER